MHIPVKDIVESLVYGYHEYKIAKENGHSRTDLAHIKGFCTTMEQILEIWGSFSDEEIKKIKAPILGDENLNRKQNEQIIVSQDTDLETPAYLRRKI